MKRLCLLLWVALTCACPAQDFASRLYGKLAQEPGNLFFSPYSVQAALAMAAGGARAETRAEMLKLLGVQDPHSLAEVAQKLRSPDFAEANRAWVDKNEKLLPDYVTFTEQFGAPVERLDFRLLEPARQTINRWVSEKTRGKIENLLPQGSITTLTRLVLTNAVYYKASWKSAFHPRATLPQPFRLVSGDQAQVPMMHQTATFAYGTTDQVAVCELPYENDFAMDVILPHDSTRLPSLEGEGLKKALGALGSPQKVEVSLPRFKIDSRFSLKPVLESLGMVKAFSVQADFSGMNGGRDLYISQVFHAGAIEVNEKGTEAAAATAVVVTTRSASIEPPVPLPVFKADHPFAYVIRHRPTGTIVFMGRVSRP